MGGFQRVNDPLRGHAAMTVDLQHRIAAIRSALRRFPLEEEVRVAREIVAADAGLSSVNDAPTLVGHPLDEAGFLSTSRTQAPAFQHIQYGRHEAS